MSSPLSLPNISSARSKLSSPPCSCGGCVEDAETCQTLPLNNDVPLPESSFDGTASSPSARTVSSSGSSGASQHRLPSGLSSSGGSLDAPKRSSRSGRPRGNSSRIPLSERLYKSRNASASTMQAEYHRIINSEAEIQVDLVDEGVGGTYFFKTTTKQAFRASGSAWRRLAIFKPGDEEPCAYNNPKGYSDEEDGEKGGIKPGEGWKREVLAHQLDHYNFANVPETIEVKLPNRLFERKDEQKGCKHGSLQKFVQSSDGCACKASCDLAPGPFPTDEVHRSHLGSTTCCYLLTSDILAIVICPTRIASTPLPLGSQDWDLRCSVAQFR